MITRRGLIAAIAAVFLPSRKRTPPNTLYWRKPILVPVTHGDWPWLQPVSEPELETESVCLLTNRAIVGEMLDVLHRDIVIAKKVNRRYEQRLGASWPS